MEVGEKLDENGIVKKQRIRIKILTLRDKFNNDRDFKLFLIVGLFTGIATGINTTVFNNFLSDTYRLTAAARGIVEFPRELPGVLIVIVLGILSFLGDTKIAIVGMIFAALGMLGIGMFSPTFATMLNMDDGT